MPDDSDFLFGPVPYQEAIDFIKSKPAVSREVFNGLLPELKGRAFTIAGVEGANVLQAVRDRIADLPGGANWDDVKKDIADDISPFLVDPDAEPEQRDNQIKAASRRAELLMRTHGFQSYQAGACQVMDRQKDVLPFWQYLTMEDDRVRPEHAALDQIVLPADHPFWENHTPPWDWGCRCQRVAISQEDRDEIAEKDAKRQPDQRLVLEGPQADHLAHGQLVRDGRSYDVRSPVQKEGGSGFQWNWKDLRIPLAELKARYDAPVWAEFEAWARQISMGEGQPTVWEWLGGRKGPPPLPIAGLDQFIASHTALPGHMTEAEAVKFIEDLRQPHGIIAAAKSSIAVDAAAGHGWPAYVAHDVTRFFELVPKPILAQLPKFKIEVKAGDPGAYGSYNAETKTLKLNAGTLLKGSGSIVADTIFHELAHWLHLHGPQSYRDTIKAHFVARTAGEKTAKLPGYSQVQGKKDKFFDAYMGTQYAHGDPNDGREIPTMVFELLNQPAKFALYWNEPIHRETIKAVLSVLFP